MADAGNGGTWQPRPGYEPPHGYQPPPPGYQPPHGHQPPPGDGSPPGQWPPPPRYGPGGYPPAPGPGYGYRPAPPPGMYFDQASGLTLPAGAQLASSGRRIAAWFLAIPLSIVTLGVGYVVWGAAIWGRGQTPALQVLGMRCWRPDTGRVAGWWWMAFREIVGRFVEGIFNIISLALSFVLMLATRERKCLHDMIAGTVVLHDPDKVLAGH
ncbi:MAG: RDD family protein [Acidimicrobiales bacterium]